MLTSFDAHLSVYKWKFYLCVGAKNIDYAIQIQQTTTSEKKRNNKEGKTQNV